jgi:hypothetical protein
VSNRFIALLSIASLIFAVGCGGPPLTERDHIETVPAAGVVLYQGKPLPDYEITFIPKEGNRPATGKTDAEGRFTLGTNDVGDGAPVGTFKVVVSFNAVSPLDPAVVPPEQIIATTPKPKVKVPAKYSDAEKSGIEIQVPEGGSTELKIELK